MDNPYFLTRQTANLMEDFERELAAGSAVYLIYGEPRVGKTRLLEELRRNRLGDKTVHWIDLANARDDEASADLSIDIERLFEQAAPGDVIVADHFELALKKTRHQLFLSWSTDGVDKRLNLIVASNLEGFNEMRQLSQQYQVRVRSFQLAPLDADETDAFLCHYLFPDHPLGKLKMPTSLRRQIADARGVIGSLIEIAAHDGSHIETAPLADSESLRGGGRVIGAVLLLFALAVGVGWYFFAATETSLVEIPVAPAPATGSSASAEIETAAVPDSAVTDDAAVAEVSVTADDPTVAGDAAGVDDTVATNDSGAADDAAPGEDRPVVEDSAVAFGDAGEPTPVDASPKAATSIDSASTTAADEVVAVAALADAASPPVVDAEQVGADLADQAADALPIVDQSIDASATARPVESDAADARDAPTEQASLTSAAPDKSLTIARQDATPRDRLLRELKRSLDWLYAGDESRGTIQILLLRFEGFDPAGYFDYVEDLGRKQVDTEQLRIVKTFTGGKVVYSVFFGDYESRQAALSAIDEMPETLRQTGPIPRSLGGIWQEIRRLPDEN